MCSWESRGIMRAKGEKKPRKTQHMKRNPQWCSIRGITTNQIISNNSTWAAFSANPTSPWAEQHNVTGTSSNSLTVVHLTDKVAADTLIHRQTHGRPTPLSLICCTLCILPSFLSAICLCIHTVGLSCVHPSLCYRAHNPPSTEITCVCVYRSNRVRFDIQHVHHCWA